jgi:signal transduction histidine kinase
MTALLIVAIAVVVALATFVTILVLDVPKEEQFAEAVAEQIHLLLPLLEGRPPSSASAARTGQPPGPLDEKSTALLRNALARAGLTLAVTVMDRPGQPYQVATLPLSNGTAVELPILPLRPAISPILVLAGWMALILFGATVVSVLAANRIIRPLELLQDTVSAVGADGMLPRLAEEGPAEIRATAQAINRLSARLRQAVDSRMRLVAAAGHDLRTPMTRMRLRAEFMSDEDERAQWLRDIGELDRIADSAIGLVREEATQPDGEAIRLDALLMTLVEEMRDLGHCVTHGPLELAVIVAGPLALTRALRNLLINAATHGKRAHVTLTRTPGSCTVLIEDEGPGIPEDLLPRVFEPFFRVDFARRQAVPGAGLGLAIAREIVLRFGGTIELANLPQRGLGQRVIFAAVETPERVGA